MVGILLFYVSIAKFRPDLEAADGKFFLEIKENKVSFFAKNASLEEVLREIALNAKPFRIIGNRERLVSASFQNIPLVEAIKHLLSQNYCLVVSRDEKNVIAVFFARDNSLNSSNDVFSQSDQQGLFSQTIDEGNIQYASLATPVNFMEADKIVNAFKAQGKIPKKFIVSFSEDCKEIYELKGDESIVDIVERGKSDVLVFLNNQQNELLAQPYSECAEKGLKSIEKSRNALYRNDIIMDTLVFY